MNQGLRTLGSVLVVVLLSACVDEGGGHVAPPAQANPTPTAVPFQMRWLNCELRAAAMDTYQELYQPENPPGWDGPRLQNRLVVHLAACERLVLGTFEHGPIHFVVDRHWAASVPPKCQEWESADDFSIIDAIYVDDQEVAIKLANLWHLPAAFAAVEHERDGLTDWWHWTIQEASSELTYFGSPQESAPSSDVDRWVWTHADGLSFMDAAIPWNIDDGTAPEASGRFSPPMKFAEAGMPDELLVGDWLPSASLEFVGHRFKDTECEAPA